MIFGLYSLTPSKGGNIYLDFRNSLLKYARNERRHSSLLLGLL